MPLECYVNIRFCVQDEGYPGGSEEYSDSRGSEPREDRLGTVCTVRCAEPECQADIKFGQIIKVAKHSISSELLKILKITCTVRSFLCSISGTLRKE